MCALHVCARVCAIKLWMPIRTILCHAFGHRQKTILIDCANLQIAYMKRKNRFQAYQQTHTHAHTQLSCQLNQFLLRPFFLVSLDISPLAIAVHSPESQKYLTRACNFILEYSHLGARFSVRFLLSSHLSSSSFACFLLPPSAHPITLRFSFFSLLTALHSMPNRPETYLNTFSTFKYHWFIDIKALTPRQLFPIHFVCSRFFHLDVYVLYSWLLIIISYFIMREWIWRKILLQMMCKWKRPFPPHSIALAVDAVWHSN